MVGDEKGYSSQSPVPPSEPTFPDITQDFGSKSPVEEEYVILEKISDPGPLAIDTSPPEAINPRAPISPMIKSTKNIIRRQDRMTDASVLFGGQVSADPFAVLPPTFPAQSVDNILPDPPAPTLVMDKKDHIQITQPPPDSGSMNRIHSREKSPVGFVPEECVVDRSVSLNSGTNSVKKFSRRDLLSSSAPSSLFGDVPTPTGGTEAESVFKRSVPEGMFSPGKSLFDELPPGKKPSAPIPVPTLAPRPISQGPPVAPGVKAPPVVLQRAKTTSEVVISSPRQGGILPPRPGGIAPNILPTSTASRPYERGRGAICFGFGGRFVMTRSAGLLAFSLSDLYLNNSGNFTSSIHEDEMRHWRELLTALPAPLNLKLKNQSPELVKKYIQERLEKPTCLFLPGEENPMKVTSERLLWGLLEVLLPLRGATSSQSSGTAEDSPETIIVKKFLLQPNFTSNPGIFPEGPTQVDVGALGRVEGLLLEGRREEAIQVCIDGNHWPMALLISSISSPLTYQRVVREYSDKFITPASPLYTLAMVYSNQARAAEAGLKQPQIQWRRTLSAILMNKGADWEALARRLGDQLILNFNDVYAAHFVYLCARVYPGRTRSKYTLLGYKGLIPCLDTSGLSALRMTEILEYLLSLGSSGAIPSGGSQPGGTNPGSSGIIKSWSGLFGFAASSSSSMNVEGEKGATLEFIAPEDLIKLRQVLSNFKLKLAEQLVEHGKIKEALNYANEAKEARGADVFINRLNIFMGKKASPVEEPSSGAGGGGWGLASLLSSATLKDLVDSNTPAPPVAPPVAAQVPTVSPGLNPLPSTNRPVVNQGGPGRPPLAPGVISSRSSSECLSRIPSQSSLQPQPAVLQLPPQVQQFQPQITQLQSQAQPLMESSAANNPNSAAPTGSSGSTAHSGSSGSAATTGSSGSVTSTAPGDPGILGKFRKTFIHWIHAGKVHDANENIGEGLQARYDKTLGRWIFPGEVSSRLLIVTL